MCCSFHYQKRLFAGLLLLTLSFSASLRAGDIDPWVFIHAGMKHLYNLDYDRAIANYKEALKRDPENIRFLNLLANAYLFQELFRLGQLDGNLYSSSNAFLKAKKPRPNRVRIKLFRDTLARVRELANARLQENPNDAEALYSLGIVHSLEATMKFTINKKFMSALRSATKANSLHEKVLKLDPGFHDAKLITGTYQYVVGSLPWTVKLLALFLGHRGNKQKGIRLVHEAMTKGQLVTTDATVLLSLGYGREKQHAYARELLEKLTEFYPRNYLYRLEIGRSYQREGNHPAALRIYLDVAKRSKSGSPGYGRAPLGRLYFEIGTMQLRMNKLDKALASFELSSQQKDTDGLVRAYARLRRGDILLQQNHPEQARKEFELVAAMPYKKPKQQAQAKLKKLR